MDAENVEISQQKTVKMLNEVRLFFRIINE